jgi:hypothetical protein
MLVSNSYAERHMHAGVQPLTTSAVRDIKLSDVLKGDLEILHPETFFVFARCSGPIRVGPGRADLLGHGLHKKGGGGVDLQVFAATL